MLGQFISELICKIFGHSYCIKHQTHLYKPEVFRKEYSRTVGDWVMNNLQHEVENGIANYICVSSAIVGCTRCIETFSSYERTYYRAVFGYVSRNPEEAKKLSKYGYCLYDQGIYKDKHEVNRLCAKYGWTLDKKQRINRDDQWSP